MKEYNNRKLFQTAAIIVHDKKIQMTNANKESFVCMT